MTMNSKLTLRHKIQLIIISISAFIFLGAIGYISIKAKNSAYRDATKLIDFQTEKYANKIQGIINSDFSVVRTLANAFKSHDYLPKDRWQELIKKMYIDVYQANPSFYNLWDSWELKYIDTTWTKSYGRISNQNFMENQIMKTTSDRRSMEGDPQLYAEWKARTEELVADLYADVFTEHKEERKLMTTLASPIKKSGNFIGLVGVDLTLDRFQDIVQDIHIKNLEGCSAFLLTHNGKYASHPNSELLNKKAAENPGEEAGFNLFEKIREGKAFSMIHQTNDEQEKKYVSYFPVKIGKTNANWFLALSVPTSSIRAESNENFILAIIVGLTGLIILSLVIYFVSLNITNPIEKITDRLNKLARGQIDSQMKLQLSTGDEIEQMANAFNTSIDELNTKNEFALKLGNGELEAKYDMLSENDQLGQSLIEIRDSLLRSREEDKKRKEDDDKRRWVNEGLAKFADILRQDNNNLEKLSYEVISNLVEYLNANQGGLFLLNDDEENDIFYELKAAYAFNRKKYLEKQFKLGEGLVGTCAIEKKTIYMTDIPQDYIQITSGLGDANPDSLLLVPLKVEEEVLGVMEIASFNKFEKHQVEFVERVAESIASTLSSVRVNLRTSQLLEKSQQQAEEMSAQEEEMRQNMEEMQATQEELSRKMQENENMHKELAKEKALLDGIMNNLPDYIFFKDKDSKFIRISKSMLPLFPVDSIEDMIGKSDFDFHKPDAAREMYEEEQEIIRKEKGFTDKIQHEFTETGKEQWVSVTKLPLYDANGNLIGTFGISKDITQFKKLELEAKNKEKQLQNKMEEANRQEDEAAQKNNELQQLQDTIKNMLWQADLGNDGTVLSANELMLKSIGYNKDDITGKNIKSLLDEKSKENLKITWEKVLKGNTGEGKFAVKDKSGKYRDIQVSFLPVADDKGSISKVMMVGYEK